MPIDLQQASLTGGELSPSLYGRVDLARYATSLRTCRNFIPRPFGGIDNRPGTEYVAEVKDSSKEVVLIPFQFSQTQNYVLEFGDLYIRIYTGGAQVESGGSPVEVTTPYLEADLPNLRFAQSADVLTIVHPDYSPRELARVSATSWTLSTFDYTNGPFLPLNSDTSIRVYADADRGSVTINSTEDIFTSDHVGGLFYMEPADLSKVAPWEANKQIADVGSNPLGEIRRNDGKYYKCVTNQTASGNEIRTGNIPPTHDQGVAEDGDGNAITADTTTYASRAGVEWEYLHSGFAILEITAFTDAKNITALALTKIPSDCVSDGGATLTARDGGGFAGDGSTKQFSLSAASSSVPERWLVYDDTGFVYDPEDYEVDSSGNTITFDTAPASGRTVSVDEYASTDAITSFWAFGAWSDEYGYPSAVSYYSDRLTFSNTPNSEPQTTWMSKVSNYVDFGKNVPLIDDDALTFTINSRQINPIIDLIPMRDLILFTRGSIWNLRSTQGGIIAPDTVRADPQYYNGALPGVPIVVIGNTILYAQTQGESIRDLAYTFDSDGYEGDDLTLLAEHLFAGYQIEDMAFHQVPYQALWAIRSDGKLLSMTYLKKENVIGWARHDTDGTDEFERVCVIPEGSEDYLYVVVKRTINGATKRYIERLKSRRYTDIKDAWFVDSGLSYDGENSNASHNMTLTGGSDWDVDESLTLTASGGSTPFSASSVDDIVYMAIGSDSVRVRITAYTSTTVVSCVPLADVPTALQGVATSTWTYQADTMSGLDHLEGRTVSVLSDGNEEEQKTVSSGSITLDRPGGKVIVGLPIQADAETLEVNLAQESIAAKAKIIPSVSLVVRDSRGIFAGPTSDKLKEFKQRNTENYTDPVNTLTGIATIPIDSTWENTGRVFIRQNAPLPLSILGIIPKVEVGE